MNDRLIIQRLWWKELRQLVPMLVMLPTIAAFLLLIYLATTQRNHFQWSAGIVVFLGMPGLFAVGAGALLVGQEKEARTIQWLSSLPIRSQTIVRIKTAAAVLGLVVLWVISGIYFLFRDRIESPMLDIVQLWVWPANSLFVLFAGLALAWKFKSALVALLLVVPIAIVPYVVAVVVHRVFAIDQNINQDPSQVTTIAIQLICSAVALVAADRFGCNALRPEKIKSRRDESLESSAGLQTGEAIRVHYGAIQSPLPALIWQFAMQSRALLIGTSAMLVAAALLIHLGNEASWAHGYGALGVLLAYLAVSWLGASVFQSDSAHQRIRFLADRGVSPRLVWLTRHAVPIAIIATVPICSILLVFFVETSKAPSQVAVIAVSVGTLFVVYSFSQWVGQVITSPIVSMITAPLLSIIPFAVYSTAVATFDAPVLLVIVAVSLPFVATYLTTRRWMDRRFGARYWCTQVGYAVVIFVLPASPHIYSLLFEPGMPRQVQVQINSIAVASSSYSQSPVELVLNKGTETDKAFESFEKSWDDELSAVELQLGETSRPVMGGEVARKLISIALLTKMSITQSESANVEEKRQLYKRSMSLLSDIVLRMRTSPRVLDQDFADLIEIAMLRQLSDPQAMDLLGQDRYMLIARRLADRVGRREARIRSVAQSWLKYQQLAQTSSFPPIEFGGYDLSGGGDGWSVVNGKSLMNRRVSKRAEHLWRLANYQGNDVPKDLVAKVARDWGRTLAEYGIGVSGDVYQRNDSHFNWGALANMSVPIARHWHGDWENQALKLLRE